MTKCERCSSSEAVEMCLDCELYLCAACYGPKEEEKCTECRREETINFNRRRYSESQE